MKKVIDLPITIREWLYEYHQLGGKYEQLSRSEFFSVELIHLVQFARYSWHVVDPNFFYDLMQGNLIDASRQKLPNIKLEMLAKSLKGISSELSRKIDISDYQIPDHLKSKYDV